MALMMTHIRFALELAGRFSITSTHDYIAGTIYPDSRWCSGIDRELTHDDRFRSPEFPTDDFTRGWQVHCVCDHLQMQIFERLFPGYFQMPGDERWVQTSVAKLVQDMDDLQWFDVASGMPDPAYARAPNGDDIVHVQRFYEIIRNSYSHLRVPAPEEYRQLWLAVGLDEALADRIIEGLQLRLRDDSFVETIKTVYTEMIEMLNGVSLANP